MIINKFVFPIKADKTFVNGAIPQGYLTANDLNKDMFYVISPSVGATIIKARFQNKLQTEEAVVVNMLASDIDINELVDKDASYYELVKDWNVWQGYFPNKALEYVSYNRAGEIGISFQLTQAILPKLPLLEFKGKITSTDFKPNENGYYIIDTPIYELEGVLYKLNDILIKNGTDYIRRKAIIQGGNTGTLNYSVDPSVYGGVDDTIDLDITDSIVDKINENTNEIKYLNLRFDSYYKKLETYNREEIDILVSDLNTDISNLEEDITRIDIKDTQQDLRLDDVENLASNNSGRLDDVDLDIIRIDNKNAQQDAKINDLENANMFKDVVYNNVNGVLTFTRYDDTTKEIDLPLELLVESGYYDEVANELVLVLANGSDIRIPVRNLLTDLDAHNIRFNGSGTNYLTAKTEVESAIKELDTAIMNEVNDLDKRIDNIIVGTIEGASAQEIIDARQGEVTLGANIAKVKSQLAEIEQLRGDYLVIGDSLSAGTPEFQRDMPTWLGFLLKTQIVRKGIWGNNLSDVRNRLDTDVIALKPKYCIILCGTNDINSARSENDMIDDIKAITEKLIKSNIQPIWLSIPPRTDNLNLIPRIILHNRWLHTYCVKNQLTFIDIYSKLLNDEGWELSVKTGVLLEDGLHLTADGHRIVADAIYEVIPKSNIAVPKVFGGEVTIQIPNQRFYNFSDGEVADGWSKPYGTSSSAIYSFEELNYSNDPHRRKQVITKSATTNVEQAGLYVRIGAVFSWLRKYRIEIDLEVESSAMSHCNFYLQPCDNNGDSIGSPFKSLLGAEVTNINRRVFLDFVAPVNSILFDTLITCSAEQEFTMKISNLSVYDITDI